MRRVFLLVFILFSVKTSFCQNFDNAIKNTTSLIELFKNVNDIPGISLSVSYNDSLVYSKGFGYSDLENKIQVSPSNTKFRIASMTKSITALTIGKLIEIDSIDISKSAYYYLNELPKKEFDFSVKEVGGHLAGIRRVPSTEKYNCDNKYNKDSFYKVFNNDDLLFEPSTNFKYSNYGFKLLGLIIEKKSGQELTIAHKQFIIDHINLKNTIPERSVQNGIKTKYYYKNNKIAPCLDCTFKYAQGCYLSTTEDVIKLGNAILFPNRILKREKLIKLITPQKTTNNKSTHYGFGFISKKDHFGNYFFGHNGGYKGSSSNYRVYPKSKLVIAICTNKSGFKTEDLMSKIAKQFINKIKKTNL